MNGFKLLSEHDKHFLLQHPDGTAFPVAKSGLTEAHMAKVRKLYDGTDPKDFADDQAQDINPTDNSSDVPQDVSADAAPDQQPDASAQPTPPPTTPADDSVAPAAASGASGNWGGQDSDETGGPAPKGPNVNTAEGNPQDGMQKVSLGNVPIMSPYEQATKEKQDISTAQQQNLAAQGKSAMANANAEAKVYQDAAAKQEKISQDAQAHRAKLDVEQAKLEKDYADGKIDPTRVWSTAGTGSKILAGISVLLSGLGSGLAGGPNLALQVIDKTINDDIEAQKADLGKKHNLLSENLRKYGDLDAATAATRAQLNTTVQAQIAALAAKGNGVQIAANAKTGINQLKLQRAQDNQDTALRQAFFSNSGQQQQPQGKQSPEGMALGSVDERKLNLGIMAGIIPKDEQKDANTEYGKYLKSQRDIKIMNDAFDQIHALQNVGDRLGSPRASYRQINQIADTASNKMAKDVDGRVNKDEIDTFNRNFERFFDSDETAENGRQVMLKTIASRDSFPTLQRYGIYQPPQEPKINPRATVSNYRTVSGKR